MEINISESKRNSNELDSDHAKVLLYQWPENET